MLDKLKRLGTGFVVAKILRGAAHGKYGRFARWAYWNTAGMKTVFGGVLATIAAAIVGAQESGLCAFATTYWTWVDCDGWLNTVKVAMASVGSFFLWIGTVDAGLRAQPPSPPDVVPR